jgi:glutamate/aspartate transport system permease protein
MSWDWQVFCKTPLEGRWCRAALAKAATSLTWTGCCRPGAGRCRYRCWRCGAGRWGLIGTLRTLPNSPWLVRLGNAWVELFRNIPLLVQIFLWYHVVPTMIPAMKGVPGFVLVVFALGFFTSARIAEQVRSGIQALPRGQRYAGMAMGFTTFQTYRYVLLPMAFRIIMPPLTSETMNIFKNSSVAFAVSVAELTMFAMQAQEETSRGIEVYLAVTACTSSRPSPSTASWPSSRKRARVPGLIVAGGTGGGTDMNLDLIFRSTTGT